MYSLILNIRIGNNCDQAIWSIHYTKEVCSPHKNCNFIFLRNFHCVTYPPLPKIVTNALSFRNYHHTMPHGLILYNVHSSPAVNRNQPVNCSNGMEPFTPTRTINMKRTESSHVKWSFTLSQKTLNIN